MALPWLANSVTQLKYRFNANAGVIKAPAVMTANAINIGVTAKMTRIVFMST